MTSRMIKGLCLTMMVLIVAGCSSTGVTTRTYVQEKERVDQEMSGGNFGYLYGQPVPEDRSDYKKTRKVYVVEFTKEQETPEVEPIVITKTKTVYKEVPKPAPQKAQEPDWARPVSIPPLEEIAPDQPSQDVSFIDYTVQKNDTLQKISKKFYDTYRKWMQIYEANKDKIKDPNAIKPGMHLRIPQE